MRTASLSLLCLFASLVATGQTPTPRVETNAHVFIEPMGGFETYLSAAIIRKKVPVLIVDDKSKAEYVISGNSHLEPAGWAKTLLISPAPQAAASIAVKDSKTGNLVFAYAVDKSSAARGNQSTAEACAKHLKASIEKH